MYSQILVNVGLTPEQSDIYLSLLTHGAQSAGQLAKSTKVQRTYIYKICQELITRGLIIQSKKDRGTTYSPMSPDHLLTYAEEQKTRSLQAQTALEGILHLLKEKYSSVEERPVITYYEGVTGIKKIYSDILLTKKDILLLRSIYDDKFPEIDKLVMEQIAKQVELGIHTRTITPLEKPTKEVYLNLDKQRFVNRHIVRNGLLKLPSQIIIYGSKVAIISLRSKIITTLIDNKDISDTFRQMFELEWELTQKEHDSITQGWDMAEKS